ncbi:unnamed protein product, partial [marine sediment metagenome]
DRGRITMRGRVGALIELGAGFNPVLTGRENIYVNAAILGIAKKDVDKKLESIIEFAEIEDFINSPVQYYSSGMKVRLGFAVAAQLNPDILVIDEVLAVGDLGFKIKCLNRISELMQHSAVIFVSHSMQFVSQICTEVMVLDKGTVKYHDNDAAAGIDYYYSKFASPDQNIFGSGRAIVSDVQISSGRRCVNGEEALPLEYGEDLTIQMKLSLDVLVSQPAIKVIIKNQAMRSVADCFSEHCGFEIDAKRVSKIKLR